MVITIEIQNQQDFQWFAPFWELLQNRPSTVKVSTTAIARNNLRQRRMAYLQYLKSHSLLVQKIEIPSRDERNAR